MKIIKDEYALYDHRFVVAGRHPLTHFRGFYALLLDSLPDVDIVGYEQDFSEQFLSQYSGNMICLAAHNAKDMTQRDRKYKTILVDHGPLPSGNRHELPYYGDYFISNGSKGLIKRIDLSNVKDVNLSGYFPTDYFLSERKDRVALVQIVGCEPCPFKLSDVCSLLLDNGYEVNVYSHVMFETDLTDVPEGVRHVQPGIDYVHTLSSCSHFIFSGTSGFITAAKSPSCRLICLSREWRDKNSQVFRDVLDAACVTVDSKEQLIKALDKPSKYDTELTAYLYGKSDKRVADGVRDYLVKIGRI